MKVNLSKPPYGDGDELRFGKYKGRGIDEVISEDPTYIEWCLDNVDGFEIDEQMHQLLESSLGNPGKYRHDP